VLFGNTRGIVTNLSGIASEKVHEQGGALKVACEFFSSRTLFVPVEVVCSAHGGEISGLTDTEKQRASPLFLAEISLAQYGCSGIF
jgi:hypothetical protein